jgi:dTDP-4-amino-4,6-dideoxygalactose transaminase
MKIQLVDLDQRTKDEKKDLKKCFNKILSNKSFVLGNELNLFEKDIQKFTKSKYCLGLNSGTDALMLGLWALGIKKGDEVITTPLSFVATIGAITHLGAIPVFVDVGEDLNINPKLIEKKITKKTKAILPVHWGGRMCKMDEIMSIAKKNKILVIEDAAQAIGGYYKKKHAGTFGEVGAFSAHPLKILNGIGDGGYLITNNKKIYDRIKKYRNHGLVGRDEVEFFGVNSRLDCLQAEILRFRLNKVNDIIKKRTRNISLYRKLIKTKRVNFLEVNDSKTKNTFNLFHAFAEKRDKLIKFLNKMEIDCKVYYPTPLHLHKASIGLGYKKGSLPKAEMLVKKIVSFPFHQYLNKRQIEYVAKKINYFYKN